MAGSGMSEKAALLAELAAARARLSETGSSLRRKLDVPARTRESFTRHRPAWLGGAALIGLLLSKLPARRRTVFVERATGKALGAAGKLGLAWSAAKIAIDLAKPFLSEFAAKHLGEAARRFGQPAKQPGTDDRADSP
jgi:hypothetical protein